MKIEYVLSALSMIKLNNKILLNEFKHCLPKMEKWVQKVNKKHNIGLLYNAYQEEYYPQIISQLNLPLYADSGGLQMIRKGVEMTEDVLNKVFEAQLPADYAFCLDDAPVKAINKKKRYVFKDKFYESGKTTGRNIKKQVDYFRKHNAKTKVFMILQGQEVEDYINYAKGLLTQISEEDYPYIAGFSLSCACGDMTSFYSTLKSILATFKLQKFDLPENIKKRIHYLGYGSFKKLLLVKEVAKHFHKDLDISADSTSITMNYFITATYYGKNKNYYIRRYDDSFLEENKDSVIEKIFEDMQIFIKKYDLEINEKELILLKKSFIKGTYTSPKDMSKIELEYFFYVLLLYTLLQLDNIMENINNNDIFRLEELDKVPYSNILRANNFEEMDKLIGKIISKPINIHPRVCSSAFEKNNKFNELF